MDTTPLSVSDALALINQTLEYAYPTLVVEGEISGYKVNQSKYVFFDIKDAQATMGCFMMVFQQRVPLEDGMKVRIVAQPKLTQWGKFSLTVREVHPIGEGSLKRSLQLLVAKLEKEGLFDPARKRLVPQFPQRIGVISSTAAAGYADFIKILNQRWGGVDVIVAHTVVQGAQAPVQIERALRHLNGLAEVPDVIVIIRGGGSLDDLSAFNDEPLARAIAASRVPVVTGIGHETDTSIADMVADVRAATPTNAAMLVVPDRQDILRRITVSMRHMGQRVVEQTRARRVASEALVHRMLTEMIDHFEQVRRHIEYRRAVLVQLDPKAALRRGYSVLYNKDGEVIATAKVGDTVTIETHTATLTAGVQHVTKK